MSTISPPTTDIGLEVTDLESHPSFSARPVRPRDVTVIPERLCRIAHALVENPNNILQALVETAVDLCGADSSAISVERQNPTPEAYYRWVAVAGQYSGMYNALFPYMPSACTICLQRDRPQHVRANRRYFDLLGISSSLAVTDGLMVPWHTDESRGTIYILAHQREQAFDPGDIHIIEVLADFAAIGVRHLRQQKLLMEQAGLVAEAAMANRLAHQINNPLQGLTNILFLAETGHYGESAMTVGREASGDLQRLASLVRELLSLSH